jgi:heterodisulfide reductase subunit B
MNNPKTSQIVVKCDAVFKNNIDKLVEKLKTEGITTGDIIRECLVIGAKHLWKAGYPKKAEDNLNNAKSDEKSDNLNKQMSGFDKILEEERMKM